MAKSRGTGILGFLLDPEEQPLEQSVTGFFIDVLADAHTCPLYVVLPGKSSTTRTNSSGRALYNLPKVFRESATPKIFILASRMNPSPTAMQPSSCNGQLAE